MRRAYLCLPALILAAVAAFPQSSKTLESLPPPVPGCWGEPLARPPPKQGPIDTRLAALRSKLNPETASWSPEYVYERCAEFLATVNTKDRCRIRFFDLSGLPREILPTLTSALFFGTNSASPAPIVYVPRAIPHTDNRLYWIDLCWYRWTPEVWEQISQEDPYFREPLINSTAPGLSYVRAQTKANAVLRADWFLFYTYDTTQFLKVGEVKADDAFYYLLLYGSYVVEKEVEEERKVKKKVTESRPVRYGNGYNSWTVYQDVEVEKEVVEKVKKKVKTVGSAPATAAEFEKFWQVDFDHLRQFPIDKGASVDEGNSFVSYQNRVLWRVRGKLGVYWRTFDVFRSVGDQDFVENPFPRKFDAGEHIFQDDKGAQFYLLTNGAGGRLEFGDPRIVADKVSGAKVLLTSGSCIHCHEQGILSFTNEHDRYAELGIKLYAATPDRAERYRQFFLQKKKMKRYLDEDQRSYTAFIADCNGLTPKENLQQFGQARNWYARSLDLNQAAREHGCSSKELELALAYGVGSPDQPKGATKGRLLRLILDGHAIPRLTWERGLYQESGLLLREWVKNGKIGLERGPKMQKDLQ